MTKTKNLSTIRAFVEDRYYPILVKKGLFPKFTESLARTVLAEVKELGIHYTWLNYRKTDGELVIGNNAHAYRFHVTTDVNDTLFIDWNSLNNGRYFDLTKRSYPDGFIAFYAFEVDGGTYTND